MSLVPLDSSHMTDSIIADTTYLRSVVSWAQARYEAYSLMCTAPAMTAAGISSADQVFVNAFISDLSRLIDLATGTVPANADVWLYNITQLLGLS